MKAFKLLFLFTEGSKFSLEIPERVNLLARITEFLSFVNKTNNEAETGKQFASGKTCLKFPTYRAMYCGLEIDGNVTTILDLKNKAFRYRGKALHNDLFASYLEKQVLHILSGKLAPCMNETFIDGGTLERPVIQERIDNQQRKERLALKSANQECE